MKCTKCKGDLFKIEIRDDCEECPENGARFGGEEWNYIYDLKIIKEYGLKRTQAEDEGECAYDTAHNHGCYMFVCAECKYKTNLPLCDA